MLPVKLCDCENKEETHDKLPMTILNKIYRSSGNCNNFLKHPIISMFDPQVKMGHEISGPENRFVSIFTEDKNILQTPWLREKLESSICSEVMELTGRNGVHPGDILQLHLMTMTSKISSESLRSLILLKS